MGQAPFKSIVDHYEACLAQHGDGPRAVDWNSAESASIRYDVMLDLALRDGAAGTLLDFGCGLGGLKEHMDARALDHLAYAGLDVSPRFAEAARNRLPGVEILCGDVLTDDFELPAFDYVVMNGIFTRRHDLSVEDMTAYLARLAGRVWSRTRRGLAFNVMSAAVDWTNDALFHPDPAALIGFVTRDLSRHYAVRNDYGLYETTVYVYREPVRIPGRSGGSAG